MRRPIRAAHFFYPRTEPVSGISCSAAGISAPMP